MGVYPGTKEKTFLEICEEQAAEGNPAAAAFVAKKNHKISPAVVTSDAITRKIEEEGFKYLGAIDPDIEAEMEAEKAEKIENFKGPIAKMRKAVKTLEAVEALGNAMEAAPENLIAKLNIQPTFDKDNPDECPF